MKSRLENKTIKSIELSLYFSIEIEESEDLSGNYILLGYIRNNETCEKKLAVKLYEKDIVEKELDSIYGSNIPDLYKVVEYIRSNYNDIFKAML